jgi:excisionase family DNA binding protein
VGEGVLGAEGRALSPNADTKRERLLTARQVAERLGLSVETILRWHRSGKLPGGRRLGSNVLRFDRQELEAWLDGTRELVSVADRSYDRRHA